MAVCVCMCTDGVEVDVVGAGGCCRVSLDSMSSSQHMAASIHTC